MPTYVENIHKDKRQMTELLEYLEGLPNISGSEAIIENAIGESRAKTIYLHGSGIDYGQIRSAFAIG